jgi:hypothetical protein
VLDFTDYGVCKANSSFQRLRRKVRCIGGMNVCHSGMYPTMLWDSDFKQATHFFFGGGFNIVGNYRYYRDFWTLFMQNSADFQRGFAQFRWSVPAYVGGLKYSGT